MPTRLYLYRLKGLRPIIVPVSLHSEPLERIKLVQLACGLSSCGSWVHLGGQAFVLPIWPPSLSSLIGAVVGAVLKENRG